MKKYVIAMKSGHAFQVEIKDIFKLINDINSNINRDAQNNFYAAGGVMFNVNDLSAIYPLDTSVPSSLEVGETVKHNAIS